MELSLSDFRRMAVEDFDTPSCWCMDYRRRANAAAGTSPSSTSTRTITNRNRHLRSCNKWTILPRQHAMRASQTGMHHVGLLPSGVVYQDMGGRLMRYALRKVEKTAGPKHRGIFLSKRWMSAMGVSVAVMHLNPMLTLGLHPQVEVEVAMARAYDRWRYERVLAKEPWLRSLLCLLLYDADACYRRNQEFGAKKSVAGFMVSAAPHRPCTTTGIGKLTRCPRRCACPSACAPATTGTNNRWR